MINLSQVEVSHSSGLWNVVLVPKDGRKGSFSLLTYNRQRDAKVAGRAIAMYAETEIVYKDRQGVIREKDSFGNDPPTVPG